MELLFRNVPCLGLGAPFIGLAFWQKLAPKKMLTLCPRLFFPVKKPKCCCTRTRNNNRVVIVGILSILYRGWWPFFFLCYSIHMVKKRVSFTIIVWLWILVVLWTSYRKKLGKGWFLQQELVTSNKVHKECARTLSANSHYILNC